MSDKFGKKWAKTIGVCVLLYGEVSIGNNSFRKIHSVLAGLFSAVNSVSKG